MEQFVMSDALKAKLETAETLEDAVKFCAEEGVEVTLEELKAAEAAQKGELNEDDLDNVAGGLATPVVAGLAALMVWSVIYRRRR